MTVFPFKTLKFKGHELAASQTVGGQWYAYIDSQFVHKQIFLTANDAFTWMKWKIKNGDT